MTSQPASARTGARSPQHLALVMARRSLDDLAAALEACDLDGLAACVPDIESSVSALRRVDARCLAGGEDARRQLEAVTSALVRCRRLGASLVDALRLSRAAHAEIALHTYGPHGDTAHPGTPRATGHAVDAQV